MQNIFNDRNSIFNIDKVRSLLKLIMSQSKLCSFKKIKIFQVNDFWNWATTILAGQIRVGTWYNGDQPYGMAGFINDFNSRIIGYATLRQQRVLASKNFNVLYIAF